ncbi:hypothetical protein [Novosphingobium sp.]|uniref:hypothetical protein n=1 Tax=Novosphingobium sp. TaxID=1874826 RepID=UPI00262ACA59|nr:hypothetical protein [Novosphingobium sp.]
MSTAERELAEARQSRAEARAAVEDRVDGLRSALSGESLGQRVKHDALARVQDTADEAIAVVRESRWVIALTGTALVAWWLRRPLVAWARRLSAHLPAGEPAGAWQRCQDWIARKAKW